MIFRLRQFTLPPNALIKAQTKIKTACRRLFIIALPFIMTGCATYSADPTVQSEMPGFCAEFPRSGWAGYENIDTNNAWFETYKITDNLYAISEPYQWQEIISYLILGKERALLFDTGNGIGNIKAVVDQLTDLPITALASHSHFDHVGGHWQFDNVLAPETAYTRNREKGIGNELIREEVSVAALCAPLPSSVTEDNHHSKPFTPTGRVADGSLIELGGTTLEVLSIPGHTPDSIALFDRERGRLFTGDNYYKGPIWLFSPETDLKAYGASIARLADLAPQLKAVHGAHNVPFSAPDELVKVRDGFEAIMKGQIDPAEVSETQTRYTFETFEFLMQANHKNTP